MPEAQSAKPYWLIYIDQMIKATTHSDLIYLRIFIQDTDFTLGVEEIMIAEWEAACKRLQYGKSDLATVLRARAKEKMEALPQNRPVNFEAALVLTLGAFPYPGGTLEAIANLIRSSQINCGHDEILTVWQQVCKRWERKDLGVTAHILRERDRASRRHTRVVMANTCATSP